MTLTHFLAETISDKYPEIEGWENDLSHLKEGYKGFTFFFLKSFQNYQLLTNLKDTNVPLDIP